MLSLINSGDKEVPRMAWLSFRYDLQLFKIAKKWVDIEFIFELVRSVRCDFTPSTVK
jgi:hypothetical protein